MNNWETAKLIAADKKYLWHPFTSMHEWSAPDHEPLVLVEGHGAILRDSRGREYIDGNSSIWTNIHGHNHPAINAAIKRQLDLVAHTSFLGFTNPAAIELAREIVALFPKNTLNRVFYSDDGSTGIEVALRIADQYWRLQHSKRNRFITLEDAYHGDTAGAASLGASAMFRNGPTTWKFPATRVSTLDQLEALPSVKAKTIAAVVIEPLVRGAAGVKLWPAGLLQGVRRWCDHNGALLIADEVLTGFGRTGTMFASERESVIPDMMILAKGLTGGYVPLAITLLTEKIFSPFVSGATESNILSYGHSYTGNALACAAARASLKLFETEGVLESLEGKIVQLSSRLKSLRRFSCVKEIRQCGFLAGIEIEPIRKSSDPVGAQICLAARKYGLLTRPIRDVIVLMPPFCITAKQLNQAVDSIAHAIADVCGSAA
jgi:adenosylmethionine-8-amino-7-oxononanoate aminotransferase